MTWYGEKILREIANLFKCIAFYLPELPNYPTYYYVIVGIIMLIILVSIYNLINNNFIKKYGYPIVDKLMVGSVSVLGIFVFAGEFWREYALRKRTDLLFPNIFLGFFLLFSIFCWFRLTYVYYKQKRVLWWLNSLLALIGFTFLFIFTGTILSICIGITVFSILIAGFTGGSSGGRRKRSYTDVYNEDLANRYIGENSAGINIRRSDDF